MRATALSHAAGRLCVSVGAALLVAVAGGSVAQQVAPGVPAEDVETSLVGIFKAIESNRLGEALARTEALLAARPNYRLAHLIKGDLLLARGQAIKSMGAAPNAPAERVRDLRDEALARIAAYKQRPPKDGIPRYLMQLRPDQKNAVVVDTRKSRLYVYENDNGKPRFVADYYITHGKNGADKLREGDQKTPLGVYHVTASLPKTKLTDLYGDGAFPINYPNDWDRRNGRGGSGIWLHGTPSDTFVRAPRASDGCVVLSNPDLRLVGNLIQVGLTPVIISDHVEWLSLDDWNTERQSLQSAIEQWRRDWEARDTDAYLRHYARDFAGDGMNLRQWSDRKRQVNAGKAWIKLALGNVSMLRYPGKEEMVVVTFDQDYKSNNLSNLMKKRMYWLKESGKWKIVDEGSA